MKALQIYYTSSPIGYENYQGFQIKALSKGIEPFISEYKKLGGYIVPDNLPSQPTNSEIKTLFPISFKYLVIEDSKYMFMKTVYVGQDYTQRYGNYFMHGLLIESLEYNPIDLYYLDSWKDEDSSGDIYLNPLIIDTDQKKVNNKFLELFKSLDKEKIDILKKIITAVFLQKKDNKQIYLRVKNSDDNIKLLTLILKFFPIEIAKNITFSAYQYRFDSNLNINITFGETEVNFDKSDLNYYYIFDFENNLFSNIEKNFYSNQIINFLISKDLQLYDFFNFVENFNLKDINDLNYILILYLNYKQNTKLINKKNIIKLLNIINSCNNNQLKEDISKKIVSFIENNLDELEDYDCLIKFYIILDDRYKYIIINLYMKKYLLYLMNEIENINNIKKIITKKLENFEYIFKSYLYNNYRDVLKNIDKIPLDKLTIFTNTILSYLKNNNIEFIKNKTLEKIIENLIKYNKLNFKIFLNEDILSLKEIAYFTNFIYNLSSNKENVLNIFTKQYINNYDTYFGIISIFKENKNLDFLISEYKNHIKYTNNKKLYYQNYSQIINADIFYREYFKAIDNKEKLKEILKFDNIEKIINKGINKKLIILTINDYINYSKDLDKSFLKLLKQLSNEAKDIDFKTIPNRFFLRDIIFNFNENKLYLLNQEINKLSKKEYIDFLNSFFKKITFYENLTTDIIKNILSTINHTQYIDIKEKTLCILLENITDIDFSFIKLLRFNLLNNCESTNECILKVIKTKKIKIDVLKEKYIQNSEEKELLEQVIQNSSKVKQIGKKILNIFNKGK